FEIIAAPDAEGRRGPLADSIDRKDRGFLEGRWAEGARGVRLMVLGVKQLALVAVQPATEVAVHEELFRHPQGPRQAERAETLRGDAEVGLQDPLELEERLVVEPDVRQVRRPDPRCLEAVLHGVLWERRLAFPPSEALFLGSGDNLPVAQQAGGAVMVEGGDAED